MNDDPLRPRGAHEDGSVEGELSVGALHQAVMRESADPTEAYDAGPAWFYAFAIAALVIAAFYFGKHYGALDAEAHIGFASQASATGEARNAAGSPAAKVSGAALYTAHCASCHQADGNGVPGAFPPLAKSPFVTGDPKVLAWIVLHGLSGPVEVLGQTYNGVMPAWANQLNDAEIAAVMTHVRGALGGNAASAVDEATVKTIRSETSTRTTPMTAGEIGDNVP